MKVTKKHEAEAPYEAKAAAVPGQGLDDSESDDSRREEYEHDGFDDPFVYSDDSASLSDAYFAPGSDDELAKPLRYRDQENGHGLSPHYPVASYYGSINSLDKAASPLWVDGSIQEDSELQETNEMPPLGTAATEGEHWKDRKRHKRQQRRLRRNQREKIARERAVAQVRGRPQDESRWKDPLFAVAFVAQLLAIMVCALRFGYVLFQKNPHWLDGMFPKNHTSHSHALSIPRTADLAPIVDENSGKLSTYSPIGSTATTDLAANYGSETGSFTFTIDYQNVISIVTITGFYACVLAYVSFGFMIILARALIHIMLVFSILLALAWGIIGLSLDPYGVISIMGFASLVLSIGYSIASWDRIPFAATNLHTALCAMRCTADITILGLVSLLVAFGWCIVWTMAFVGLVNSFNSAECTKNNACEPHVTSGHVPLYIVLLFSFHWTNTVIKNIVRATVSSAIGTWWFSPEEIGPFCTKAVTVPLLRAMTTSLGSICYGSLVVQPVSIFSAFGRYFCCILGFQEKGGLHPRGSSSENGMNGQRNVSVAVGSVEAHESENKDDCIRHFLNICDLHRRYKTFSRSCNRWSSTYIGLYAYDFVEAGDHALQLFETREWLEVVKDNLIQNTLLMASVIIGGSTGTFAVVVEETDGYDFTSFHKPIVTAFLVGSVIGYVLSNILLLGVVASAVNTVLVCFAAGPFDFDKNHPRLSREMREVWSSHVFE